MQNLDRISDLTNSNKYNKSGFTEPYIKKKKKSISDDLPSCL